MDDLKSEKFGRWLFQQMEAKGWNMTDLATRAGVSKQVISKYINNPPEKPDNNVLTGIARAFQLPPETVFRAAGLLPHTFCKMLPYVCTRRERPGDGASR